VGSRLIAQDGRLVVAAFCFLLLTAAAADPVDNGNVLVLVADSIVTEGRPVYPGYLPGYSLEAPDGSVYAKFGIGMSLVMAPAVFTRRVLSLGVGDQHTAELLGVLVMHAVPSLIGALTFWMLLLLGRAIGLSERAALLGAAAAIFTTFAWTYFRVFYSEGLMTLCATGAVAMAVRARDGSWRDAALAGMFGGLALLTKPTGGLVLGCAGLAILLWRGFKPAVICGLGALPLVAVTLWFNAVRSGNPLSFGYTSGIDAFGFSTPLYEGLYGLALSPGKGIAFYAPLAIAGAWAWRALPGRRLVYALCAAQILLIAVWWSWHGAESWGPRLIVPIIPLLTLPAGAWLAEKRRWALGLAAFGLAIQVLGATISWPEFYRRVPYETWAEAMTRVGRDAPVDQLGEHNLDEIHFQVSKSPIVGQVWLLANINADRLASAPWGDDIDEPQVDYSLNWWPLTTRGKGGQAVALAWLLVFCLLAGAVVFTLEGIKSGRGPPESTQTPPA